MKCKMSKNSNKNRLQNKIKEDLWHATSLDSDGNEKKGLRRFKEEADRYWYSHKPKILIGISGLFFMATAFLSAVIFSAQGNFYSFSPQDIRAFSIAKKPVQEAEFEEFIRAGDYVPYLQKARKAVIHNPKTGRMEYAALNADFSLPRSSPAVLVNYIDAVSFCNWKSSQDGLIPAYKITAGNQIKIVPSANGYRLPTAEEWEHAAMKHKSILRSGISEWCSDVYEEDDYMDYTYRIIKGYNAYNNAKKKLAEYSSYSNEKYPADCIGFRLVMNNE